jgi:hypothetical protein
VYAGILTGLGGSGVVAHFFLKPISTNEIKGFDDRTIRQDSNTIKPGTLHDHRTGELNGSRSGSARFTLPPMCCERCLAKGVSKSAVSHRWRWPFRNGGSRRESATAQLTLEHFHQSCSGRLEVFQTAVFSVNAPGKMYQSI